MNGPKAFDPIGPERAGPALATVEACKLTVTVSEREVNRGLPHCRQILYQLNHKGSPRILECIAYYFSRGSSQPKN